MDHRHHAAGHDHHPAEPPKKTLRDKVAAAVNDSLGTKSADSGDLHDLLPGEGSAFQRTVLLQLQRPRTKVSFGEVHIYTGSVPADVVAQRRAKNKRARKARRTNRIRNAA